MLLLCRVLMVSSLATLGMASTIICKNDKSVRSLRIDKTDDGGCRAVYTKLGVDQIVGSNMRENRCDSLLEGIRKTLEASVWKCREVKDSTLSNLSL